MRLQKQIKIWKYLAWTLPFTALATVSVLYYFNLEDYYDVFFSTILVGFISIAVFWWWWAMDHIVELQRSLKSAENRFISLKKIFELLKKDLT